MTQTGSVELSPERPTETALADLHDWVIWQFPVVREGWLAAAAHPPVAKYGWLPAQVHPEKERVILHGHRCQPFDTPEEAKEWLQKNPD